MKFYRTVFTTLLLIILSFSISAQDQFSGIRKCGVTERSDWMVRYKAGEIAPVEKSLMTRYVPLRIVVLGDNNGTGYGNPNELLTSFSLLNSDFEDQNIQFYISELDFVDRTRYNSYTDNNVGIEMMSELNKPGVINSYIVRDPNGSCGVYFGAPDALVLGKSCMGTIDRTWSHEMGHLLSLDHTFYGWEGVMEIQNIKLGEPAPETVAFRGEDVPVERTDGSNCETAGDGFCDTEPDYLMQRWSCERGNIYRDSLLDPDSVRFAVPAWNIMSYALDNCINGFSEEQQTAMQTNLTSRGIDDNSGENREAPIGEDLSLIAPPHNTTLDFSDFVELSWSPVENADFYIVQINTSTNFNGSVFSTFFVTDTTAKLTEGLNPGVQYHWRVRPVSRYQVDSDFSDEVFRFRNGAISVATIDAALDAAITLVPNPVANGGDLFLSGRDLGLSGRLTYELIDPAGRILLSRENLSITSTGINERINTDGLAPGIYFLRLRLNEKLVTKRVIVTP